MRRNNLTIDVEGEVQLSEVWELTSDEDLLAELHRRVQKDPMSILRGLFDVRDWLLRRKPEHALAALDRILFPVDPEERAGAYHRAAGNRDPGTGRPQV